MPNKNQTRQLSTWGKIWRFTLCVAIPLGGGFIISLLTRNAMEKFGALNQPPLAPPAWLFPVAWTILYILIGMAEYFIYLKYVTGKKSEKSLAKVGLIIYNIQLVFNFIWSPLFFNLGWYWAAFVWLIVMWVLIVTLVVKAHSISKAAFWMLLPYLIWCTFAAYLNCGIAILN